MKEINYQGLIDRYMIPSEFGERAYVNDNTLKIPEMFLKVIKKTIPEVDSVTVDSFTTYSSYSPLTFDETKNFKVNITLSFPWDSRVNGSLEHFSQVINTAFSMMYTDKTNISFSVVKLDIQKRDFEKEFFEFFTKG